MIQQFQAIINIIIVTFAIASLSVYASTLCSNMSSATYTINKTWNNQTVNETQNVDITLCYDTNLTIKVSAPFYDDPKLPDMSQNPGTMDKLYDYEVVEVFLLGSNEHYLEVELGPRGQYLVLQLAGYRNVTRSLIDIPHYQAQIDGHRWHGLATIPNDLLPEKITHFNAYAIHGSNETRQYMSLFPAPYNDSNYTQPDFHRLELFGQIDLFK